MFLASGYTADGVCLSPYYGIELCAPCGEGPAIPNCFTVNNDKGCPLKEEDHYFSFSYVSEYCDTANNQCVSQ
ncbi:MAG TPA: hypothetical protein EYN66_21525 [Myxococcales bacterium]|nr:hypothetical protein [Myxococcales bacterium]